MHVAQKCAAFFGTTTCIKQGLEPRRLFNAMRFKPSAIHARGAPSGNHHRPACRRGRHPGGPRKCRKRSTCRLHRTAPSSARPRSACRIRWLLRISPGCGRAARHPRWKNAATPPNRNSKRHSSGSRREERYSVATTKGLRRPPGRTAPARRITISVLRQGAISSCPSCPSANPPAT